MQFQRIDPQAQAHLLRLSLRHAPAFDQVGAGEERGKEPLPIGARITRDIPRQHARGQLTTKDLLCVRQRHLNRVAGFGPIEQADFQGDQIAGFRTRRHMVSFCLKWQVELQRMG